MPAIPAGSIAMPRNLFIPPDTNARLKMLVEQQPSDQRSGQREFTDGEAPPESLSDPHQTSHLR